MEVSETSASEALKQVKTYETQSVKSGLQEAEHMPDAGASKSYFSEAYGDSKFTNELLSASTKLRIDAEGPAADLFEHIGSGYAKIIPERVKNASFLKDAGKERLIKTAGTAWEIRKEAADEEGKPDTVYFLLRDDVDI